MIKTYDYKPMVKIKQLTHRNRELRRERQGRFPILGWVHVCLINSGWVALKAGRKKYK